MSAPSKNTNQVTYNRQLNHKNQRFSALLLGQLWQENARLLH
ncbi:hypothetical protein [Legionella sainthelensi]|nr:hypothetical protein [Legionella sainthelensi]